MTVFVNAAVASTLDGLFAKTEALLLAVSKAKPQCDMTLIVSSVWQ